MALMPQNCETGHQHDRQHKRLRRSAGEQFGKTALPRWLAASRIAAISTAACSGPPTFSKNAPRLVFAALLRQPARTFGHGEEQARQRRRPARPPCPSIQRQPEAVFQHVVAHALD